MSNNQIQDGASVPFFEGQLVTPEILNVFVNGATLKKGAISEQPQYGTIQQGTYSYSSGATLSINKIAHGLVSGSRVNAVFTNQTGGSGSVFDGNYEITVINSDTFTVQVVGNELPSIGTVEFKKLPSINDEVIVNDVSDASATKPKKVTVSELLNSNTDIKAVSAEIGVITGKAGNDLLISPDDGPIVTDGTYASTDGLTVTVTKANHGLIPQVNVIAIECTDTNDPLKGPNYSGVFIVEAVTENTFTYVLKQEQFETFNEFQENEYDAPIVSTGTATYRRIGSVQIDGSLVVQGEVFANGPINARDDMYVYGKARFGELVLPKGRSVARPAAPEEGQLFYNKDDDVIEIWRRSQAFPLGSWETFDKVSSQIIIPAQNTTITRVVDSANTWYSKTMWTMPIPIPYKQYEITLPQVRIWHRNYQNDGSHYGKLELIAQKEGENFEYVIAGFYQHSPSGIPFVVQHDLIATISPWNKIVTPDDIDMSDKKLTLRISSWQNQNPHLDDNRWILPWNGFVRINPLVRKGGTHIPTPWKSKTQINSLNNILPLEREFLRWFSEPPFRTPYGPDGGPDPDNSLNYFPDGIVCPIPVISARPFNSSYGNSSSSVPYNP